MRSPAHNDYYAAVARGRWQAVIYKQNKARLGPPAGFGGARKRRKCQFSCGHCLRINNALTKLAPIDFTSAIR